MRPRFAPSCTLNQMRRRFFTNRRTRIAAVSILLAAFVTVVVLPNDIGSHELPAVAGKAALSKASPQTLQSGRSAPAATLVLLQATGISHCTTHDSGARHDCAQTPALKRSLPLLT